MKNLNFPATCRRTILPFLILNIGFLTLSFTPMANFPTDEVYAITRSKITILGKMGGKDWEVATTAFDCGGKFTVQQGELENISGFCFKLPIDQMLTNIGKEDSTLCKAIQKSDITEISFAQNRIMILPIMKMVHMVYDIKALGCNNIIPIQLQYLIDSEGQIRFKGKQVVLLSELGIKLDQVDTDVKRDEITIEIEFTIAKNKINQLR